MPAFAEKARDVKAAKARSGPRVRLFIVRSVALHLAVHDPGRILSGPRPLASQARAIRTTGPRRWDRRGEFLSGLCLLHVEGLADWFHELRELKRGPAIDKQGCQAANEHRSRIKGGVFPGTTP